MGFQLNINPRKWLTKEYWRLHVTRASYATRDGWSNEDVDVVPVEKRTWRTIDFLWLWLSDGANVGTMQQAGSIVALGLSWREAAVAM
jgi:NCS1 family nucleobase:cation symporter-1